MHRTPSGDRRQALQKAAHAPVARREAEWLQGEAARQKARERKAVALGYLGAEDQ